MAKAPSPSQNRFALVSSLYGPGAIACWYLTILSVIVSWTLHPRKRKSGSIDVDLIAVLTLPAVAACDLALQVRTILDQGKNAQLDLSADWKYLQTIAAIEAPFRVTVTFMAISVILFILAARRICIRRAIVVAFVGLPCFGVECFIHFSEFMDLGLRYQPGVSQDSDPAFSRSSFADRVISILWTLVNYGLISAMTASKKSPTRSSQDIERANSTPHRERTPFIPVNGAPEVSRSSATILEIQLAGSSWPTDVNLFLISAAALLLSGPTGFADGITGNSMDRVARGLFPRTACSITDLDQAIALAAGATVLGFSIYSVSKAHYHIWSKWDDRTAPPPDQAGTELRRLRTRLARN